MFADPTYLHIYDNESDDEEADEDHSEKPWVIDMCELMRLDDTSPNVEKKKDHNNLRVHPSPHKKKFVQMGDIMQEVKKVGFNSSTTPHHLTHSQLLDGLKCESK
jgi:hypothetical protein